MPKDGPLSPRMPAVSSCKTMTEVRIRFPDTGKEEELALWDTYEQALRYLCSFVVPLMERRALELKKHHGVSLDTEFYFNKRGHVRKAIMKSERDLRDLADVLWKDGEGKLEWQIKSF